MNNKISSDMKAAVIRLHLMGESRNQIARMCALGQGTVTNIIYEWKHSLSNPDADSLRELSLNLSKFRIDASQCANGFRTFMIIKKAGINEDDFESFMTQVFSHCQQAGITPEQIVSNLKHIVELSKFVPFENISDFTEAKMNEIKTLEENTERARKQKMDLNMETSTLKELRDVALQEERMTRSELDSYSKSKEALARYGISMENNIPKLVQLITNLKNLDYDPKGVLSEYFDLQTVKAKGDETQRQIICLESHRSALEYNCANLQDELSRHSQTLSAYNQLKTIGFGLRELKILKYTITEVAKAHNISEDSAVRTIFERLETGLEIEFGRKEKVAFNPPFFAAIEDGSNHDNHQLSDEKRKSCSNEKEKRAPLNSFSETLAFLWWYLFQGQHQQLQERRSAATAGITSLPQMTPNMIKNINLEFKKYLENINIHKETESVHKHNPWDPI